MMGYLQRIVSQAMPGRAPRVHPMVGSLSSASTPESPPEVSSDETFLADQKGNPTPVVNPPNSSSHPVKPGSEQPPQTRSQEQTTAQVPDKNRVPLKGVTFEPVLNRIEERVSPVPVDDAPLDTSQANPREDSAFQPQPQFSKTFLERDIVREPRRNTRKQLDRPAPLSPRIFPAETRRLTQSTAFRGLAERPQAPDEIHINIGRIELTAVPPAPHRPAAPARKSLNLDEYLKRRNGRNG
jgi:hypothetical protein